MTDQTTKPPDLPDEGDTETESTAAFASDNPSSPMAGASIHEGPPDSGESTDLAPGSVAADSSAEAVNPPIRATPPPVSEPLPFTSWSAAADGRTAPPPDVGETTPPPVAPSGDMEQSAPHEASEHSDATDNAGGETPPKGAVIGVLGSFFSRIRPQRKQEEASSSAEAPPTAPSVASRASSALRSYFDPRLHLYTTVPHRWVFGISVLIVLIALLSNSGGVALIVMSALLPTLIAITLTQHDAYQRESNLIVAGIGAAALTVGLILGILASWVQGEQWFNTGKLNFGAGGFSGPFSEEAGPAPFVVWLISGLMVGAMATAALGGAIIALRHYKLFRNEAMDAVKLGGVSAAGYAIGVSIVYWWPMVGDPGPVTSVQDWTLRVVGVAVLRPAVFALGGATLGFGMWLYATKRSSTIAIVPAFLGGLIFFLLHLIPAMFQSTSPWIEATITGVMLVVAFPSYRYVLDTALTLDREGLDDEGLMVCPHCRLPTPRSAFCSHCQQPLPGSAASGDTDS